MVTSHGSSLMALACLLAGFACGHDPSPSASTAQASEDSTSADATTQPEQTDTESDGGESETDSGESETDSGEPESDSGTETETDTTGAEPDLPPETDCVPWAEAYEFDQLCFGPPVTLDPEPMHVVERVLYGEDGPHVYAAGPDDHRLYDLDQLQPGGSYESLALLGTTVQAIRVSYLGDWEGDGLLFMIVTRDPHALVLIQVGEQIEAQIHTYIALDVEPTAATRFRDAEKMTNAIALTDVDANLHVFEVEFGVMSLTSTRMLPEPLERLDANYGWIEFSGTQLLGRSNATLTAWFLSPPIAGLGPIEAYPYPAPIYDWDISGFTDFGPPRMLTITQAPSIARMHSALDFQDPGSSVPLSHPVNAMVGGEVPDAQSGTFALSTADARVAHILNWYGEGGELLEPTKWIEVAPDCVSLVALDALGFLCASTSEGLVLISPE